VTFALMPGEPRAKVVRLVRDFRAIRDVELALHVAVIGDTRAPFMAPPTLTLLRFARRTRSPYFRVTPRRPPKKSNDDARRSASPTSSSAPTSPTRSPRSSLT
jgi:hypothetical protein